MLAYFKQRAKTRHIGEFWQWFAARAADYAALNVADAKSQEKIKEMSEKLRAIHPQLSAEAEAKPEGLHELVITANGFEEAFEDVRATVAAAPPIAGWRVIAFRQPRPLESLQFFAGDKTVTLENIWYTIFPASVDRVVDVVVVVVTDYDMPVDAATTMGLTCLNALLGEVELALKVGQLQFFHWRAEEWNSTLVIRQQNGQEGEVMCKNIRSFRDDFYKTFEGVLR